MKFRTCTLHKPWSRCENFALTLSISMHKRSSCSSYGPCFSHLTNLHPGGNTLVQGTRNSPWVPPLLHSSWCMVSGLYICWDGEPAAIVPWGLWDWWTVQNFQVSLAHLQLHPSCVYYPSSLCFLFTCVLLPEDFWVLQMKKLGLGWLHYLISKLPFPSGLQRWLGFSCGSLCHKILKIY